MPAVVGVSAQLPLPPVSVMVQLAPVPSLTAMVPPGVPLPGATAATVALTVTGWPVTDGSGASLLTVTAVAARFTACAAVALLVL